MTAARALMQKSIIISVSSLSYCVVQLHSLCVYICVKKFEERERESLMDVDDFFQFSLQKWL